MDRRTVLGLMPVSASSDGLSWAWVVDAGWMTRDLTSATLASREKMRSRSMKALASAAPPMTSKEKMEPPPLGKYFLYRAWLGLSDRLG